MIKFALVPKLEGGTLTTNAADLAGFIGAELAKYNYAVTPETYKTAKEDRAKLNSIATQLAESRKHIENEVFGSWKKDKATIMDIEKQIKEHSSFLGDGIRSIDDAAKQEKARDLEATWNSMGGSLYPFVRILDQHKSWMNKTAKKAEVEAEMQAEIGVLQANEQVLETQLAGVPDEHKCLVMEKFYKTMDLPSALVEVERIKMTLARIAEQKAKQEAAVRPDPDEVQPKAAPIQPDPNPIEPTAEPIYRRAFLIDATRSQLIALADAMKKIGITIVDIRGKGEQLPDKLNF